MNLVEEAITAHWGEKCDDYEQGCPVCDAWREYENLVAYGETLKKSFTEVPKDTQFVAPISLTKAQKPTLSEWMAWLKQGEK
jgi:hypothetical protein